MSVISHCLKVSGSFRKMLLSFWFNIVIYTAASSEIVVPETKYRQIGEFCTTGKGGLNLAVMYILRVFLSITLHQALQSVFESVIKLYIYCNIVPSFNEDFRRLLIKCFSSQTLLKYT